MLNIFKRKKEYGILFLTVMLLAACIMLGIFCAGYSASLDTANKAEAAVPDIKSTLLTGRGLDIYNTSYSSKIYSCENILTSYPSNGVNTSNSSDYLFTNMTSNLTYGVMDGTTSKTSTAVVDGVTYTYYGFSYCPTALESGAQITVTIPITVDSYLYKAINDKMLNVQISAYSNQLNLGTSDGNDSATSTLTYISGANTATISQSVQFLVNPNSGSTVLSHDMSGKLTLPDVCGSEGYIQLVIDNFVQGGNNFTMIITKLAFKIAVYMKDNIILTDKSAETIDVLGTRNAAATSDMVKQGDIIYIVNKIQQNDTELTAFNGTATDTSSFARAFRYLYLNSEIGTARTDGLMTQNDYQIAVTDTFNYNDLVTWTYNENYLTRVYDFSGCEDDLINDYSGVIAAFVVNDSNVSTINISCSIESYTGETILSGVNYTYIVDNENPNAPAMDASTTFYNKYISDKSYYTKVAGYVTEQDILGNTVVKSVKIGSATEGSDAAMSAQTLSPQGLSTEIIYYRVTKLVNDPNNVTASNFSKEEATGIYCMISPTLLLVNGVYTVTGTTVLYEGLELMLREGTSSDNYSYPEQGIFKVEFISYDYVGNKCSNASAVVIRVDVSDYTFEVITKIGSTVVTSLTAETFTLSYYALSDDNKLETRGDATFKRGDRIVLKLDFTATGYSNYILTYFQTPAGDAQNTATYPYDINDAIYITNYAQSKTVATFVLGSSYSGDDKESNRKLILTFKARALIAVTNLLYTYAPETPRTVSTIATIGGSKVSNVTILTTYSETANGTYRAVSSDFPVNAATYYYKCELTSTNYYGFTSGTMRIVPATPVVTDIQISAIDYGDSIALRNTIYDTATSKYMMSDSIFCSYSYYDSATNTIKKSYVFNKSSDGIYGYFSIIEPSATSDNYTKPKAGITKVKILFTPILMVDAYTPQYTANGNFVLNSNYFTVTISDVSLTVNHSPDVTKTIANLNTEGNVELEYTGEKQNITVSVSAVDDGRPIDLTSYLLYSFTEVNTDGGVYTSTVPTEAGTYTVIYYLNTANSLNNFTGTWTQTLIITKRELAVYADDMTMEFQMETKPSAYAVHYSTGGSTNYYSLNYVFSYYYYNAALTNAQMAVESNQVPNNTANMFNSLPCKAGQYLVKIDIAEDNYANESDIFIKYTINKVSSLDNTYLSCTFPSLGWTSSTSNYNLFYLQPLKAIAILQTNSTIFQYKYHYTDLGKIKYQYVTVGGQFIVAHTQYTGDYSAQSVADFVTAEKEYTGLNAGDHTLYLYFVPDEDNIQNFNIIGVSASIKVGKAQPLFTNITIASVNYGKIIDSIDDITITKAVRCKLYTENGVTYYQTLDSDSYSYSFFDSASDLLPAGTNNIIVTFVPEDIDNFEQANGTVSVIVNKKQLTVVFETDDNENYDAVSGTYIYPYKGYVNTAKSYISEELITPGDSPSGAYAFYQYDAQNIFGALYTNSVLIVGKYAVRYTINDNNYQGSNYYVVEIMKDDIYKYTAPLINQAATAVSYGKAMNMVVFSGGIMLSDTTNTKVNGTFYFDYPTGTLFDSVTRQSLKLKFVPDDTVNYNIYEGDSYTVDVTRADISSGITLSVRNDYVYGDVAYNWAYSDTSYTTSIYTNGTLFSSTKVDETYYYLTGTMSINNRPMTGYFSAGTYNITFTIDETSQPNYTGSKTVTMTIAKQKALLQIDSNQKSYDNKAQSVNVSVYLAVIDGQNVSAGSQLNETVSQTFYKNGVLMNANPSAIGIYTVDLVLLSTNYEYYYGAKLTTTLTIKVDDSQIIINNLNQIYSDQRALGISLGANTAVYIVKYCDISTGTVYDTMPVNAGTYEVYLIFDSASNNGYSATIVYSNNLIIEKYTATIVASDIVSSVYTGKTNTISVRTEPYNLTLITTYCAQGETEFTSTEVLNANTGDGYHQVKFVINNSNYKGEKIIRYYITPAPLTVESNPTFNSYVYNTDTAPVLKTTGSVRFSYDTYIANGEYIIPIVNIKYLDVGTYNVSYNFTAWDVNNNIDTNYQLATGTCTLVITQQVIDGSNIIIPSDIDLSVNYNTGYHYVYAVLCALGGDCTCADTYTEGNIDKDGLVYNIASSNKDFIIKIRYNGSSTPARSLGEYILNAEIISKNYTGSVTFASKLIVELGIPEIRIAPTLKASTNLTITGSSGSYIYPTVITNDLIAGDAYIANTYTRISGTFTVIAGQTLTRANINYLNVLFTPTDTNFTTVIKAIEVNVTGYNPLNGVTNSLTSNWSGTAITSNINGTDYASVHVVAVPRNANPVYGANLSDFDLYFVNTSDGSINTEYSDFGKLSFVNTSYIPEVGEAVQIKYTPYDSKNAAHSYIYNVMYGLIDIEINKIAAPSLWTCYLKGFEGKSLNEDMVFNIIYNNEILNLSGGSLTIYTDDTKTELFDMNSDIFYGETGQVYIVYSSDNYTDIEMYIDIDVFNRIVSEDINVLYESKAYSDGTQIVLSDLGILINGTVSIGTQYITLYITDSEGNITSGAEIGTYNILIIVDNGEYYGRKQINGFAVVRKDISSLITLSVYSSTYNDIKISSVLYNSEALNTNYYTKKYKLASAADTAYSSNLGEDAGTYNIKVTVNSENYTGTRIFTYVINPIIVRVTAFNKEAVYNSLDAANAPTVSFMSSTTDDVITLNYTLYYYNASYTITNIKPNDVGVYTVRMIIDDSNYAPSLTTNYVEFTYTITQATVMITSVPTVLSSVGANNTTYNIKYGQSLSDIKLTGGVAARNNITIAGLFSVQNGTIMPDAGSYNIAILFTPYNSNYSTATVSYTITVAKGDAQVIVDNLYADYDSLSKKNWITVTVQPSGVKVAITYTNSKGEVVAEPTNAGTYYITATSLNNNYNVTIAKSSDGSTTPRLVITKASVLQVNGVYKVYNPRALSITCGDSLAKSSLSKGTGYGEVYYEGFSRTVSGSFTYVQSALIFSTAGTYTAAYLFTPDDINNFDTYTGTVEITVNMAYATISVANTSFVYGEGFTIPTFTTSPAGLSYAHNITFNEYDTDEEYDDDDVIAAGTYYFKVWITSANYAREENYLEFSIYVAKKNIDLSFVNTSGVVVTQYITTYGVPLSAQIILYDENNTLGKKGYLLKDAIVNDIKITDRTVTRYVSTDSSVTYDSHIAPTERGSYEVNVSITNDNYTASGTLIYTINRGVIAEIVFDKKTLETQIYGSVVAPIITTRPSNIAYYIVYQGYDTEMPDDAGSYSIMVYFNDDNYEKKQVSAMFKINPKTITVTNIQVSNKVYDGISALDITGKLSGILLTDEVELTLTATTVGNDASIGYHYVEITDYSIKGLQSSNYVVTKPVYSLQISIYTKQVSAVANGSYVTSSTGFNAGTTVEITELDVDENETNLISKAMGVQATVIGYSLLENGQETIMNEMIKVYIAIPSEYTGTIGTDFEVEGAGALAGQTILFTQEGNYITFYTTASGSVVFSKTEFKYGLAVAAVSIIIIIIGIVVLIILNPIQRKRATSDTSREKAVIKRIKRGY